MGISEIQSRTRVPVEDAELEFVEEHDSFEKVYSLTESKAASALNSYAIKMTRPRYETLHEAKPTRKADAASGC